MNLNLMSNYKIKQVLTVLVLTTLFVTAFAPGLHLYGEGSEYVWVLRDVIDYDEAEAVKNANRKYEGIYHWEVNYSRGNFTQKQTYTGKSKSVINGPDIVYGESMTIRAEWSSPPRIMRPGEKYPIDFYLGVVEDNSSFYPIHAYAYTELDNVDLENSRVTLDSQTDWKPINETLVLEPKEGRFEGQKLPLTFYNGTCFGMKTVYEYEWMKASKASKVEPPAPYTPEPTEVEGEPDPTQEIDYEVPKDENGNYIDSGCRFNNLGGEVLIRRGDDPLGWKFAQPDMVIYAGDHIRVKHDSSAEMVLSDLTTFKMKPESEIIMNTESEKENKLKLLAGKVWINVKKMITDGTMDVEMSQAVAGIKGTTFIVEETGSGSVLKVLDGEVELRTNDGDRLVVKGGLMATVKKGSLTGFEPFSKEKELNTWDLLNQAWEEAESSEAEEKSKKDQIYITTEGDFYPLASDDFRYSTLEGWETVNGTWKTVNGVLVQSSNYYSGGYEGGTYAVTGSPNWTDYSVSARIMSKDDDKIGFVFRYLDENNFYILSWDKQNKELPFIKVVDGITTELLHRKLAYEKEKWYQLQVDVVGNEMSAYVDGKKLLSVADADLSRGKAGLYCHGNDGSYFDDFKVEGLQNGGLDTDDQVYVTTEGDFYSLFSDDFSYSTLEDWEIVNGTWNVEDGVLAQTSNYYKKSLKGGTYAVTGSPNWTNYSVSSRIMSKDNDKIGLVFRYLNPDNFYILSWGKEREELLFTKVAAGKTTEILHKKLAYKEEKWYRIRVDVVGNEMSAYIDNRKIFSVTDDDLTRGMAGPYCWGNKGSYFDDFRVTELSQ